MEEDKVSEKEWNEVTAERDGASVDSVEVPPEQPLEDPEQVEAAEQAPTPEEQYARLSPEDQAKLKQFDQMAAVMPQLVNELKEAKGRIGALQSEWAKAKQAASVQPNDKQVAAAVQDPEKWATLKKDYPEWGDAIESLVNTRFGAIPKQDGVSQEQIESLVAQRADAVSAQLAQQFNEKLVAVKHPSWRDEVKTPAFAEWFQVQPAEVQSLAQSPDGLDAIRMLDLYAEAKKKPVASVQQDRKALLASATQRPVRASTAPVTKRLEDMTPAELWEYEAAHRQKR